MVVTVVVALESIDSARTLRGIRVGGRISVGITIRRGLRLARTRGRCVGFVGMAADTVGYKGFVNIWARGNVGTAGEARAAKVIGKGFVGIWARAGKNTTGKARAAKIGCKGFVDISARDSVGSLGMALAVMI